MKLTTLLIVVACIHVSAHSYSQTVSFSGKDVPLQQVFASIEKQTGLSFFFNYAIIKDARPITLHVINVTVEALLDKALEGQELKYFQKGKTVFILKKESKPSGPEAINIEINSGKQVDVKGQVTNLNGEALAGATVSLRNTKKTILTDEKGMFELKNVSIGALLEVSFIGYQRKEVEVNGNMVGDVISVLLEVASNSLDVAQVIAYGNTTQRMSVGNVTTVGATEIGQQPVNNPLEALEGRVPGMFITQANGLPGSGITVHVEGQNSITKGNDPLYVIDGVPYVSQMLNTLVGGPLGQSGGLNLDGQVPNGGSPMSYINPSDIESISVLKDADATSIYGSRAANGAVLITTKKGKAGRTLVDVNLQNGWGAVTRKLKLLNTPQYLQMRHEAIANDGLTTQPADRDINGIFDTTRYTDWQKALIGGTAQYTNANAAISGGTTSTQYLVGGTFHRESTVFPGDFRDEKGSLHFSLNGVSPNERFHFQLSGSYMFDDNQLPQTDFTGNALFIAPDAPTLYNPDGTLNWMPIAGRSAWSNPLSAMYQNYENKTKNLIGNSVIGYTIIPGLEIRSSFGYNDLRTDEFAGTPLISTKPEYRSFTPRYATYTNNDVNSWIVEPQVSYKKAINQSKVEVLLGSTIEQLNSNGVQLLGFGYNSDNVLPDMRSASQIQAVSTIASVYRYNALFGRLNYNLQEKYILDLTARRDGSSRFGPANEFHNFGAIGAGWIFSQENYIKNRLTSLSFGKLKVSYGTTGNDQIGDYRYLSLYTPTSVGVPYQGITGLSANGLTNPNLQWENTRKLLVGSDLGFLKDRVLLNINYYRNRSSNELLSYALPIITGFSGTTQNFPATVQNSGWEFTASSAIIKHKNFKWSVNLNLTIPKNKLISFPNLSTSTYSNTLIIGQPVTVKRVYHYLGVNDSTGVYQFRDSHGNATSSPDPISDVTAIVNTQPNYYGGIQNNFSYKGIQLDIFVQFVKQIGPNTKFGNPSASMPGYYTSATGAGNQPSDILNRWQKPGDQRPVMRFTTDFTYFTPWVDASQSDAGYSDASFIRLKNVSLSWQLPVIWMKRIHVENCRIYLHGQNLATITKFKGMDPENQSVSSLPTLRVLTTGIQISF